MLALVLLGASPVGANAPQASQTPKAVPAAQAAQQRPSQQLARDLDPRQFVDAASHIIDAASAGQAGSLWDTASPVLKAVDRRDQFIAGLSQRVAANGVISPHQWVAITRTHNPKPTQQLAAGDYLSVAFIGTNRAGALVRGTVSFHLDTDAVWRLAGYAV
jgi:hypothetical protein